MNTRSSGRNRTGGADALETPVRLQFEGPIARVTLNRPESGNAIDLELARELMRALHACEHQSNLHAVVISGAGRLFCAGGDLKAIHAQGDAAPLYVQELLTHLHESVSAIARIPAPVIAGINGTAAGAGFALACACDLLIAARSARFLMAYTRVGLTPDGSSTWYLPRLVGLHRALALTLLNDEVSAETLKDWGVVLEVVDDDALEHAALELAGRLASGSVQASAAAKRLIRSSSGRSLESQMTMEAETLCHALLDAEARAGLAAFNNRGNGDTAR
ncbi:MAG TPA: enoyl-CoA hydratase/isomerase family protein [Pseudomonadales bacterium]